MAIEERIRYMLRVAARAERDGNRKMAELFRRMAKDALPATAGPGILIIDPSRE